MDNSAPFDLGEALLRDERQGVHLADALAKLDREYRECEDAAAEYDRMTCRQIAERNRGPKEIDQEAEIRAALIASNLEGIRFWSEDIGALVAVREAFPGNNRIRDLAGHLIRLEEREMDDLTEEISQWR